MDGTHTEEARWDRWAASLGGYAGARFSALYREAIEFAGVDGCTDYLEMAMATDEAHEAHKRDRAAARLRAAVARRRADAAAAATLQRVNEIKLAADDLLSDLRLADDPDLSTRPERGRAEVEADLRFAMALANRAPTAYQQMLPPVGDLTHALGLKP